MYIGVVLVTLGMVYNLYGGFRFPPFFSPSMTMCICVYIYMYMYMYDSQNSCAHTHSHTHTHARTHARTHAHTRTRMHARTHTHTRRLQRGYKEAASHEHREPPVGHLVFIVHGIGQNMEGSDISKDTAT